MSTFESPPVFAERVNLPEDTIRLLAKEGKIPYIKPGKSHIHICVEPAIAALQKMAEETANYQADRMPIYATRPRKLIEKTKKRSGRPPDSVRLANQQSGVSVNLAV